MIYLSRPNATKLPLPLHWNPDTSCRKVIAIGQSVSYWFCSVAISRRRFASFILIRPYWIRSSLPNLVRNDLNEISRKYGQISLSVSRDNEKSRSTRCITHYLMSIIDGNIGETHLSSGMVVKNVLLKVLRKSEIASQEQPNGEWAMIDNIQGLRKGLTFRVSSDFPTNAARTSIGYFRERAYRKEMKSDEN